MRAVLFLVLSLPAVAAAQPRVIDDELQQILDKSRDAVVRPPHPPGSPVPWSVLPRGVS